MATKYLYFAVTATNAITVNTAHLATIDIVDADTVTFYFRSNDATDFSGSATVDITSGYNKQWLKALIAEIATSRKSFITVADDVNSDFFTTASEGTTVAATSCTAITLS